MDIEKRVEKRIRFATTAHGVFEIMESGGRYSLDCNRPEQGSIATLSGKDLAQLRLAIDTLLRDGRDG